MELKEKIRSAVFGLAIGDAVGVPAEFMTRKELRRHPVTDMSEGGFHGQPMGTWSDDTSMTLAAMDGMIQSKGNTPDLNKIMDNFCSWSMNGKYAIDHNVFDIGGTCSAAIDRRIEGEKDPLKCGDCRWDSCGNGSLMRILPAVFWSYALQQKVFHSECAKTIKDLSCLTHASPVCITACIIYAQIIYEMLNAGSKEDAYRTIRRQLSEKFMHDESDAGRHLYFNFEPIISGKLLHMTEDEISGSGYVVGSLTAALWCFLKTDSYRDCILKAVNLGDDTDTTAAIAGGLAGLCYGFGGEKGIPDDWMAKVRGKEMIEDLCVGFAERLEVK